MSIRDVFMQHSRRKVIDQRFVNDVKNFHNSFINKNPDHSGFFGSGLIGAHRLRWTPQETQRWFDEVLQADPDDIKADLVSQKLVDPNHIVGSDPLNLSTVFLVHLVLRSNLPVNVKKECAIQIISILHFKYISSIMTAYFGYGSDPQIALRCYEAMNYKFDLKVYKTWGRLIRARAESILSTSGIHIQTFMKMNDDEDVQYVVTDIQTRIRVVIQKITALYYEVRAEKQAVVSVSRMIEVEGEVEVRDMMRTSSQWRRYLLDIITDGPTFVRQELVGAVVKMNPSMNPQMFLLTLQWVSSNYTSDRKLKAYIDFALEFGFNLIRSKGVNPSNLVEVSEAIKGVINASRNKERDVLYLRKEGENFVRKATGKKSPIPVSGERTGLILYLVLRSMTAHYFKDA